MSTRIAGLRLPNPVMTASGCAAAGRELGQFIDVAALAAVVTKSIFLSARAGRPTPRWRRRRRECSTPSGCRDPASRASSTKTFLVGGSGRPADRVHRRRQHGGVHRVGAPASRHRCVAALEVNISCPNVENRGLVFACDPDSAARVIAGVRRETVPGVPVLAKLTADVTDIVAVARACVDAGADGLSLINTLLGLTIDATTLRPVLAGVTGGLSGPAMRPVALRCVYQVHAAIPDVPIVGIGGVRTGADALEFVAAGASAVQVGTAVFGDPHAPTRVLHELTAELSSRGISKLTDLIGIAH